MTRACAPAFPAGFAPPGSLVEVGGGRRLHLYRTGVRGPSVVIEAGSGDFSFDWTLVQGPVSEFARVCSYDRAGYAWSDPGPMPRTFRQITLELHTALLGLGVPGPYVLVGHSYGGFLVRAYADHYPRDVVGMVLVESMHEDSRVVIGGGQLLRIRADATGRAFPEPRLDGPVGTAPSLVFPAAGAPNATLEPPFDQLPDQTRRLHAWAESQPRLEPARGAELEWSPEELDRIYADPRERVFPLGQMPLVVITRRDGGYQDGPGYTAAELEAERLRQQEDLARLSHDSLHIVDPASGHNVHVEDPQVVVDAIRSVVEAVRTRSPVNRSARGTAPVSE